MAPSREHLFPEIEVVVEETERYWVVEKMGEAGDLAAKVDPRQVGLLGAPATSSPGNGHDQLPFDGIEDPS